MPSSYAERFTLHFTNNALESPRVARKIEHFLEENHISSSNINKILLCVDELITNIIAHAYTDTQEHAVQIECRLYPTFLELELRDDGIAFDPTQQTRPNIELSLEDKNIGGLGIHLVKNLMDNVAYQREGVFNVLTLTKILD